MLKPLTKPYTLKDAVLTIASDDFTAAVSEVKFTPSTQSATWRGIGGNVLRNQTIAEWACTLSFLQDLDPAGLSRYLHENDGRVVPATFAPVSGEGPTIEATLILTPGDIGGSASQADYASASVTLAVNGRPTFDDVDPEP